MPLINISKRKESSRKKTPLPKKGEKICRTCKEPKLLTEFYKSKKSKDGRRVVCGECVCKDTKKQNVRTGLNQGDPNKVIDLETWKVKPCTWEPHTYGLRRKNRGSE